MSSAKREPTREELKARIHEIRREQNARILTEKEAKMLIRRLQNDINKLPPTIDMSHFELALEKDQLTQEPPTKRKHER